VPDRNGTLIKWGAIAAIVAVIGGLLSIFAFAGKSVDGRIDNKILAYEAETEAVHQKQISTIQKDIAVMKVEQKQIADDIEEIKEILRSQ